MPSWSAYSNLATLRPGCGLLLAVGNFYIYL
jgi:hypothetical protein